MKDRLLPLLGVGLLLALLASTVASAQGVGATVRVSVSSSGTEGNSWSDYSAISPDGRYVAFVSDASNLVTGDTNGKLDVFVRDTVANVTVRASVASNGSQGNDHSFSPSIAADGRYVAFASDAGNLVPGDTNGKSDVFVHDLSMGVTFRVSVYGGPDEMQAHGNSSSPSISADGRYIAFDSDASDLVSGDTNGKRDVFVYDRSVRALTRVSVASDGTQGNDLSLSPSISADGRYVAFQSSASNLVSGDTNEQEDIFVRDTVANTTTRVSTGGWLGTYTQGNDDSWSPAISADGQYVAFLSDASNLTLFDTNGQTDIFVRDLVAGTTILGSAASDGRQGNTRAYAPAISADGRYVAFESDATNLVVGDTNGGPDVFVRDLVTGVTTRVSMTSDGAQGNAGSVSPAISADGRYVAFVSTATNLVAGDTNGKSDIFVHDRCPFANCGTFHRTHSQPDFNADNQADLLWRHATTGQDAVWLMNDVNPPSMSMIPAADTNWKIVGVGDLNGDANTDIVWRNTTTGQNIVWFMNVAPSPVYGWLPNVPDQNWKVVGVADLDGDNRADIVWRNTSTGQNVAWVMYGVTVMRYITLPSVTDTNWKLVGIGDLNGDEMADLIWRNLNTGQNITWFLDGRTVASYEWLPTVPGTAWNLVGVGDLTNDFDADLIWHNTTTGENVAWLMTGSKVGNYISLPTVTDPNWKLVALADVNGDKYADPVWRNFSTGQNIAWMMGWLHVDSYNWLPTVADLNWRVVSPASLLAAFNSQLPGPTEVGATKADPAKPMASEAPKDAKPMWSDAPQETKPFWTDAPKDVKPMGSDAPKDAKPFWSAAPKDTTPFWSAASKDVKPFWSDVPKGTTPMGMPR